MSYFSVVIPTYNRIDMLLRVLHALEGQTDAPPFEVVVVNDGSRDETTTRVEEKIAAGGYSYPFTFVSQENGGPGRARNHGAALAKGRFVVFIGDDTVPEERFLAEHWRTHRESGDDRLVACLGYTGWPDHAGTTRFMEYINDYGLQFGYKLIADGDLVPFNFFYTSNISLDRELLASMPFDSSFPSAAWEDIELAYRFDKQGLKIRYNASAVTRHHHPTTVDSFARRQYTVGRSGAIFYQKHPELGGFLGVHEVTGRKAARESTLKRLRFRARLGERFSFLANDQVFEKLMREHYLRGLRDGLRELGAVE